MGSMYLNLIKSDTSKILRKLPYLGVLLLIVVGAVLLFTMQYSMRTARSADLPEVYTAYASSVSSGGDHTCAIFNDDGLLYCWGKNDNGQLGDSSFTSQSTPASVMSQLPTGAKVKQVSAGLMHTCAVVADESDNNQVYCWGKNDNGQLGNDITLPVTTPNSQNSNTPVAVANPSGVMPVKVSAGFAHTCAVYDNGSAYCWGNNDEGQLGDGTGVFGVDEWTTIPSSSSSPQQVQGSSGVTDIAAGATHTCMTANNESYCWGGNGSSQFGNNDTISASTPQLTTDSTNTSASSSGFFNSCGVIDGAVSCWGDNTSGQIGDGTNTLAATPKRVDGPLNAKTVTNLSSGYAHTCTIADNQAYCWGDDTSGQLLDNDAAYANKLSPVAVVQDNPGGVDDTLSSISSLGGIIVAKEISGGFSHTCAIYGDADDNYYNDIFCGGINDDGELGVGNTNDTNVLVRVDMSGIPDNKLPSPILDSVLPDAADILLSWSIPAYDGVFPISGYKIEVSTDFDESDSESSTWSVVTQNTGTTATTYIYDGTNEGSLPGPGNLDGNITYSFRVSAVNDIQASEPSNILGSRPGFIDLTLDDNNIRVDVYPEPAAENGVVSSAKHVVGFTTNIPQGIKLSLNTNVDHNNLVNAANSDSIIDSIDGDLLNPVILSANTWGFALSDRTIESSSSSSSTTWSRASSNSEPPTVVKTTNAANPSSENQTNLFYGVNANMSLMAGVYKTTITYTSVANP